MTDTIEQISVEAFAERARAWLAENGPRRQSKEDTDPVMGPSHEMGSAEEQDYVSFAREFQAKLHDAGFAGITVPKEYGGQGLTRAHQVAWSREAAKYPIPPVNTLGFGLFIPTLLTHGTEEQKRDWIPKVLRNEKIFCQLFSEPGAGSDLAGVQSRAERHDGEWILNGQKVWTSGAQVADIGGGPFRTDPDLPKHQGLSFFIVDMRQPGVEVRPLRQITGEAHFNEVFFTDARVPDDHRVSAVGDGWRVSLTMLMNERLTLGGGGGGPQRRGGGEGAIVRLARELGLFEDADIRNKVIDLFVHQRVLSLLGRRMAEEMKGRPPGPEFSIMKLMGTRIGSKITELAPNLIGAGGAAWEDEGSPGQRWTQQLLASRAGKIAGGSDEILLNIIGERVLGLPQDPRVDKEVPFRELKIGTTRS
ncbi:MAG: acyl-CoA dehydrogenase family protein [Actinomycetota bacterium]